MTETLIPDLNRKALASTERRLVVEFRTVLRQGLESEVARLMQEFEATAASIGDNIGQRIGARLPTLIQQDDDADGEAYEGTVRLRVEPDQSSRSAAQFVRELRQNPRLRLMRLAGGHNEGVDIWLRLREPLWLKKILSQMEGVVQVSERCDSSLNDQERLLHVWLKGDSTLAGGNA